MSESGFVTEEEKSWATVVHLSSFGGFFLPVIMSLGLPLVIWLIKKPDMPFVDMQGREVINFNISISIYMLISAVLMYVLVGFVLLPIFFIIYLVCTIRGAMHAYRGQEYRYPITISFMKRMTDGE